MNLIEKNSKSNKINLSQDSFSRLLKLKDLGIEIKIEFLDTNRHLSIFKQNFPNFSYKQNCFSLKDLQIVIFLYRVIA